MKDRVRIAQYFKVQVPNRPGVGARMLGALQKGKVNLLAFSGFPRKGRAQLDFVPAKVSAFLAVAKRAKWRIQGPKTCFLVEGSDRLGAVAALMVKLAKAKLNVTAIDAVCSGKGRYGALLWVKPHELKKAGKLLRGQ